MYRLARLFHTHQFVCAFFSLSLSRSIMYKYINMCIININILMPMNGSHTQVHIDCYCHCALFLCFSNSTMTDTTNNFFVVVLFWPHTINYSVDIRHLTLTLQHRFHTHTLTLSTESFFLSLFCYRWKKKFGTNFRQIECVKREIDEEEYRGARWNCYSWLIIGLLLWGKFDWIQFIFTLSLFV